MNTAGNAGASLKHLYVAGVLASQGPLAKDPKGPTDSNDPAEPGMSKRVTKGGSFLCTDQYCARYMPGGRGKEAPDTGTNHLGFRLVRDSQ
jgi:formylglycine-generating enzyme required for sulfatase activity